MWPIIWLAAAGLLALAARMWYRRMEREQRRRALLGLRELENSRAIRLIRHGDARVAAEARRLRDSAQVSRSSAAPSAGTLPTDMQRDS